MKIRTITCHDVYNVGASLQAYALQQFLALLGHDVKIIDYKPDYLSRSYSLTSVDNPRYDKPVLREAYLLAKLPSRLRARKSERKKNFDLFRSEYLKTTERYSSFEELQADPPEADVYLAGSDQIWNPLFRNGRDPAFYLAFAPKEKIRASYAASFATELISEEDRAVMKPMLSNLDAISVREKSALTVLQEMGLSGRNVCDPVFLIQPCYWRELALSQGNRGTVFLYDFDQSELAQSIAEKTAKKRREKIVSFFPTEVDGKVLDEMGPREFLGTIMEADVIVSNSFHATAFAMMFCKEFYVVNRQEDLNTRMRDLLELTGLSDRLIQDVDDIKHVKPVDWEIVTEKLYRQRRESSDYLIQVLSMRKQDGE